MAMGDTWTKDGERRQAGPMVEFTQSLYLYIAAQPEQIIQVASTPETIALIREMAAKNRLWGVERIRTAVGCLFAQSCGSYLVLQFSAGE
jgi:hypothetical protein